MSDSGYFGQYDSRSNATKYEAMVRLIEQITGRMVTATLVKVVACSNSGGVAPVGTVDCRPLISQVDGQGKTTPHGTIYGLPYCRIQGGANAVIIDPKPGDMGLAVFCSTDASSAKATLDVAGPGSRRRFDWADGVFVGLCLSATAATSYVQFDAAGNCNIVSTGTITLTAGTVNVVGTLEVGGVPVTVP